MGTRMRNLLDGALGALRYEPTEKRLRAYLDGVPVADTLHGLLVWEPRRLVPTYAVPHADFAAELESAGRVDDLADLPFEQDGYPRYAPTAAALAVLNEFGGLASLANGPGVTSAQIPFTIFPAGGDDFRRALGLVGHPPAIGDSFAKGE